MVYSDRDMLKLIEAMDAFVRLIVITVFATGILQLAGVMRNSKSVQALPQYAVELHRTDGLVPLIDEELQNINRSSLIDNFLKIPMSLTTFNELVHSARPAMQRLRDLAKRRYEQAEAAAIQVNRVRRRYHEGPVVQLDGSSSRVLLRI